MAQQLDVEAGWIDWMDTAWEYDSLFESVERAALPRRAGCGETRLAFAIALPALLDCFDVFLGVCFDLGLG